MAPSQGSAARRTDAFHGQKRHSAAFHFQSVTVEAQMMPQKKKKERKTVFAVNEERGSDKAADTQSHTDTL